jgi:hypothetical protein
MTVYVCRGEAYLPTLCDTGTMHRECDPVFQSELSEQALARTMERVKLNGHPKAKQPTLLEIDHPQAYPLLKATKMNNWRQLARLAVAYSVSWRTGEVALYMSKLDRKSRFIWDMAKTRHFPPDVDMIGVAKAILEDAHSRQAGTTVKSDSKGGEVEKRN